MDEVLEEEREEEMVFVGEPSVVEDEKLEDRPLELLVEPEEEVDSEDDKEEDEEEVDKGIVLDGLELDDDALELLLEEATVVVNPLLVELDGGPELLEVDEEERVVGALLLEVDKEPELLALEEEDVLADPLLLELVGEGLELLTLAEEEVVDSTLLTGVEELVEIAGDVDPLDLMLVLEVDEELVASPLLLELDRMEVELLVLEAEEVTTFC